MRLLPLTLLAAVPSVLAAQSGIYPAAFGVTGPELRSVSYGGGLALSDAAQVVFRAFGGLPLTARLYWDMAANYAATRLRGADGSRVDLEGPTDTQVRATYTLGRNRAVLSLLVNVPTGEEHVASADLALLRIIAKNFLPFPVSSYGAGLGVTGGATFAQAFGQWTVGLAGSLRYLARYSPFADLDTRYRPGLESRVRIGVRRPLGDYTSATAGFTFSTFGADDFSGAQNFSYRPGNRYVGELLVARQVRRSTVRVFGWAFFRSGADSSGAPVPRAREHIIYGGTNWSLPLGRRASVEPALDARTWRAADGAKGTLVAASAGARLFLAQNLTLASSLRLETGNLHESQAAGASFVGVAASAFLRVGGR